MTAYSDTRPEEQRTLTHVLATWGIITFQRTLTCKNAAAFLTTSASIFSTFKMQSSGILTKY